MPDKDELIERGLCLLLLAVATFAAFMLIRGLSSDEDARETYASLAEVMSDMDDDMGEEIFPGTEDQTDADDAEDLAAMESDMESLMQTPAEAGAQSEPEASAEETQTAAPQDTGAPVMISKFDTLYAQNPDICGWIYVPGTKISYPVMYTPDEPEYYLRRNFYKESSRSGTPFIGKGCTVDSDCLLIYGHNMQNGTMFSTLTNYKKQSFWKENPAFRFNTLYEYRDYQVFAAVTCRLSENEAEGFQYYQYSGDMTQAQFTQLRDWLLEHAAYDTGVQPEYGDQILIVSTCGTDYDDERFIVAAFRTPTDAEKTGQSSVSQKSAASEDAEEVLP